MKMINKHFSKNLVIPKLLNNKKTLFLYDLTTIIDVKRKTVCVFRKKKLAFSITICSVFTLIFLKNLELVIS